MNATVRVTKMNSGKPGTAEGTGEVGLGGLEYYRFSDYLRLLKRRKWTLASVSLAVALAVAVVVYLLPNVYQASTIILVDPGKVPQSFVKSTATLSASERLSILQQQILSNTKLLQIIDEMGLYTNLKAKETPEEIVDTMRKDIIVAPIMLGGDQRMLLAFEISYSAPDANTAAKVSNRLASMFIAENMRAREQEVMGTADFFDRELDKAKKDLDAKSETLQKLRSRYVADLPESQSAHVQALTSLQLELRSEMDGMSRAQQQKVYLEALLNQSAPVVNLDDSAAGSGDVADLQMQLARMQQERDQLAARYGPQYPDILKREKEIQDLQQQIAKKQKAAGPKSQPTAGERNPVVESQIAALGQEMQLHEKRQKDIKDQIAYHESKLELAPEIQQQIAAAEQDYENAQDNYKRLQDHKFAADVSSDVETRQKGERFEILDPAQPPDHPYKPQRLLVDAIGLVGGILLALGLVLGLELLDGTVKTSREFNEKLGVPVLGEIPWTTTLKGSRNVRVRMMLGAAANAVLALAYAAVVVTSLKR